MNSSPAMALLNQTSLDLMVLKDALQSESEEKPTWTDDNSPLLLATPQHLWSESKIDFAASVTEVLRQIWTKSGTLIQCTECNQQRMHVSKNHQVQINSGPATSQDLTYLMTDPRYANAKSIVFIKETASGVEAKVIRIVDGAVVWQFLANGSENLNHSKRRLRLVTEMERRKRGEALAYTFIELGFYPSPMAHISFLEQWGSYNEHLSGVMLSLVGPTISLGIDYRYLIPQNPRVQIGWALLFPLQNAISPGKGIGSGSNALAIAGGTVQYAFSPTFGVHGYVFSDGTVTMGISLYNPIWFPFML
jgi:hypothetical protein